MPAGVFAVEAAGFIDQVALMRFAQLTGKKNIAWHKADMGDCKAGSMSVLKRSIHPRESSRYQMTVNQNHNPNVQFATLAHEFAHLFLEHPGPDLHLSIPTRPTQTLAQRELEAESTAYIVCARNGVESRSESCLTNYVAQDTTTAQLDMYQIMRAVGQIETLQELSAPAETDKSARKRNETLPLFPSHSADLFDTAH